MDTSRVLLMRQVLASTPWVDRTRDFARAMRVSTRTSSGLLLVGTPEDEPWHFAAHLDDEARFAGIPEMAPVLVRHTVPAGAPAHLSIGIERLEHAVRGETLFVVAQGNVAEPLLDRVEFAKGRGATILSLHAGDHDLESLAHESLVVPRQGLSLPASSLSSLASMSPMLSDVGESPLDTLVDTEASLGATFDIVEHLVSSAIGETALAEPSQSSASARGFRDRLGRLLDTISGSTSA